jgi:type III secretion protein J
MLNKLCRFSLVAVVVLLTACGSKETLLRDLSEPDANEIIAVLHSNSIGSEKLQDAKGKTFTVMVSKGHLPQAVSVLRAVGLPRQQRASFSEVFKSNGFAPTAFEERVRFIYATSQELERTISYMEGVLVARVHVVMPEKAYRRENQNPPSASVFIAYDDRITFEAQIPKIRKLVAESIENLDPANVDILASPSKVDLTRIVRTPVTTFLGMSVSPDTVPFLTGLLIVIFGLVAALAFAFRAQVKAHVNAVLDKFYPS